MKTPNIRSAQPYFPPDEIEWILQETRAVLESGALTRGPRIARFETLFADYTGVRHSIAVSNGTTALEIALRYYELDGAEVIVPTNTFLASANAVIFAGGKPVFSDIEGDSLCIGLEQIKSCLSDRTRGIVAVHVAGMICPEIDAIREFCKAGGLFLIEDAAHAHGAELNGCKAGSLGDSAGFSFFPTKLMTTAEGGMITTNDDALAEFARTFRNHGVPEGKAVHTALGHNYRMDELSAVLGLSQLRQLDTFLQKRRTIAAQYEAGLGSLEGLDLIKLPEGMRHSYYKFPVLLSSRDRRNALASALKEKHHIDTGTVYWPPCHLHPAVPARPDLYDTRSDFPISEEILPRILCLPIHARLDEPSVERVIEAVKTEQNMLKND